MVWGAHQNTHHRCSNYKFTLTKRWCALWCAPYARHQLFSVSAAAPGARSSFRYLSINSENRIQPYINQGFHKKAEPV